MPSFGETLRKYRQSSKDPDSSKQLSQERLGELLGKELGIFGGYSGAAVSDWERGMSKIHADDRPMLVGLINVLYKYGGLKTISEANEFLEAGNYRALSLDEKKRVFPTDTPGAQTNSPIAEKRQGFIQFLVERVFYGSISEELKTRFAKAEEGPAPFWPRKLIFLTSRITNGWSPFHWLRIFCWAWVYVFNLWLIMPFLRWSFINQEQVLSATIMYTAGSLCVPLLIGLLTDTGNNRFWRERPLAANRIIRLYTYQGAFIGFQLGYLAIFPINLCIYYLGLRPNLWFELIEITWMLICGYSVARLIPYNLWKAYDRLELADGSVFFVVLIIGPLGGLGSYLLYPFFLDPINGLLIVTLAVFIMAGQYRRTNTTIIPADWIFLAVGFALVLYQITITENVFSVVVLACAIIIFSTLLTPEHMNIRGLINLVVVVPLFIIALLLNPWAGRIVFVIGLLVWWRWKKKYLPFSLSFLCIYLLIGECTWMWKNQWLSDIQASIIFSLVTLLLLLWEHKSAHSRKTG